ncbi:hypothetical protein Acr_12g0000690 [Actinidia rufa]|uniref:Reverse transcriptase domain-containing protein n=1 Tax=Actinidia rufa TaxID=165716 RepID=A0A7J0FFS4_9ERIC|nr:hypothetical protein Acr_12g0000690 [Actinidia rufa]
MEKENCKGTNYTMMQPDLTRAGTPTSSRYRASSVAPYARARCECHSTFALLGRRSRPTVATMRARSPAVPKLGEVTTIDECPPELSPLLPPRRRFLAIDGKLSATLQRHGQVSHPLTDTASVEPRAEFRLMRPAETIVPKRAEGRIGEVMVLAQEGQNKKQHKMHLSMDSHTDSKTVATSKRRKSPEWTGSKVDLRDAFNANVKQREAAPRYQTPFSQEIEGLDPPKKFTPPRFTLYDSKSDSRSHASHVRQMMARWNHMDALMCRTIGQRRPNQTRAEKDKAKPNSRFDRGGDDEVNPMEDEEEDLPLGTIHIIGGPYHPDLDNRIRGEIRMVRQIHEVLSVHSLAKKPRVAAAESGSLTFTKVDLERVQHPHYDPLVIQLRMNNYNVRRVLVDTRSSVEELNVLQDARLVKQRGKRSTTEHVNAMIEEVEKLKEASAITENAGATYQRMVTKMFEPILGKTMDAYIDDMVVKSEEEPNHIRDLTEVFDILKRYKLRLNAVKCAFGVNLGKFLGHLGIEANPEQITAISDLVNSRIAKERKTITRYFQATHELALDIGYKLAQGMGLNTESVSSSTYIKLFKEWPCQYRRNKFHFTQTVDQMWHESTQTDFLTILQDDESVGGLEVMDKNYDKLIAIDPMPGSLLANLGDLANVRKTKMGTESKQAVVEAPPELVDSEHPRLYVRFTFEDYRMLRLSTRSVVGKTLELLRTTNS